MRAWLDPAAIRLDVTARDWRDAVTQAGRLLVARGAASDDYVRAMVATVEELGPYIVIGPGIAIPHARPEAGALRPALSLVRLRPPVPFGNPDLDPVDLVWGLAAADGDEHVDMMAALAAVLSDPAIVAALRRAETPEAVLSVLTDPAR